MNCETFQCEVFEYVEGSLDPHEQAGADRHLAECAACRQLLAQEQLTARTLRQGFQQGTQHLALPPDFAQRLQSAVREENVIKLVQPAPAAESAWVRFAWPTAIAACILVTSFRLSYFSPGAGSSAAGHPRPAAFVTPPEISLQLEYCIPKYTFHREGSRVVDALECNPHPIEISFHRDDRPEPL